MNFNKSILFLIAVLTGLALSSCQDKNDEPTPKPDAGTAQVQIFYMAPLINDDNAIYRMTVGEKEYTNPDPSMPLMYAASGCPKFDLNTPQNNNYLTIPAGTNNIALFNKAGNKVYEHSVTLDNDHTYLITVTLPDRAPIITDTVIIPEYPPSGYEIGYYAICFSNFLYENDNTPTTEKLQLKLLNRTTNEYESVGKPVAFGQTTEATVHQYPYNVYDGLMNSRGFIKVVTVDSDGKESELTYRLNGEIQPSFTDYWTLQLEIGHKWTITGVRDSDEIPVRTTQWLFI